MTISTEVAPWIKKHERTGLPLDYVVKELRRARKFKDLEDRKARLEDINRELWKPEYEEVSAKLKIHPSLKLSISAWVLEGEI